MIVRNIEERLVRALKRRAAQHGRSAEAEHREILRAALEPPQSRQTLKELLLRMPRVGEDADFERIRGEERAVEL